LHPFCTFIGRLSPDGRNSRILKPCGSRCQVFPKPDGERKANPLKSNRGTPPGIRTSFDPRRTCRIPPPLVDVEHSWC